MRRFNLKFFRNRGMTLIEMLIVVSVGMMVVALLLFAYNSIKNKLDVGVENENISNIHSGARNMFRTESMYGANNELIIKTGIVPEGMRIMGFDTIRNVWGGDVCFTESGDNYNFTLEYIGVPKGSVCVDLVKGQRKTGWEEARVGDFVITFASANNRLYADACKSGPSKKKVDVTFATGDIGATGDEYEDYKGTSNRK